MVDHRDLLIELRDGAKGVEARLLRGTRQGFRVIESAGHEGWMPFAGDAETHARLVETGRVYRNDAGKNELIDHGIALWESFDATHRTKLLELRRNGNDPIARISLRVGPSSENATVPTGELRSARDLWLAIAWECLLGPKDGQPKKPPVQTFFLGGDPNVDWSLRRVLSAETRTEHRRLPRAPIRVLLLLTSLHAEDEETRNRLLSAAKEAIPKLREVFANNRELELQVAGSRCDLEQRRGKWFLPDSEIGIDRDYGNQDDLETLLTKSADDPGRQAIFFFGHSDAKRSHPCSPQPDDALARTLRFRLHLHGENQDVDVDLGALCRWLSEHPLEFVAALNCSSSSLAEDLLELAPDVIATSALVEGLTMANFVVSLLKGLCEDELLSTAFVCARNALPNIESRPLVVQISRTLDDVSFLGPNRRAVARYHEKIQRKHGMLTLPDQSRRIAELERVHVQLELTRTVEGESWTATREALERGRLQETLSFEDLLEDDEGCWILRGVAGAGKTTTLRRCAIRPPEDRFVVYLSLPIWLGAKGNPPSDPDDLDSVLDAIATQLEVPALRKTILTIAQRGLGRQYRLRVVALLDAFDELGEDERETALKIARTLAEGLSECPVVLSSRETAEIGELGDRWRTARLLPLDRRRQLELVLSWHRADAEQAKRAESEEQLARKAQVALDKIHAGGPRVQEFAGNPLLLTLLTNLHLDGQERFDIGLHRVMEKILDRLLRGEWLRKEVKLDQKIADKDRLRVFLRALSWSMLLRKEGSPRHVLDQEELIRWMGDAKTHPALAAAAEALKNRDRMNCSLRDIPGPLAEESPFCPEDPARMQHWTFDHNLLQEALCAEHWFIVELHGEKTDAAVDQAISHLRARIEERSGTERNDALDFWTEPTALLAGWMGNDKIVVDLLKDDDTRDLGLRAMRAVDQLSAETVGRALELLPDWAFDQERANAGEKGPRVEAYEIIAAQARREDVGAIADVLAKRAGLS